MDKKPIEEIMKDFKKIITDLLRDLLTTFPEIKDALNSDLLNILKGENDSEQSLQTIFDYCKMVYPSRFFEILYQNDAIFKDEKFQAEFLPGIDFKVLWQDENLSDKTRETIWKYLQLILFTVVSDISDGKSFGDTSKMFESINQDDFKSKLEETMEEMQKIFNKKPSKNDGNKDGSVNEDDDDDEDEDEGSGAGTSGAGTSGAGTSGAGINLDDLPNPKDIQDHVNTMMEGKLGKLAREIAEETAADMNMDTDNVGSVNDVFTNLLKNPTKLMGLVKNVGSKLDEKLKAGDINETELLKEASVIMQQMKNIPGMQGMMNKMGMGGGKMNMNGMQSQLNKNIKNSKYKDRLRAKLAEKNAAAQAVQAAMQQAQQQQAQQHQQAQAKSSTPINITFSKGEKAQRTPANAVAAGAVAAGAVAADAVAAGAVAAGAVASGSVASGSVTAGAAGTNANAVDTNAAGTNAVGTNAVDTKTNPNKKKKNKHSKKTVS